MASTWRCQQHPATDQPALARSATSTASTPIATDAPQRLAPEPTGRAAIAPTATIAASHDTLKIGIFNLLAGVFRWLVARLGHGREAR